MKSYKISIEKFFNRSPFVEKIRLAFVKLEVLLPFCIIISIIVGFLYSIFNTDSHHWGFIVSTALESIQGKRYFSEIYIQYGVGQPLFYHLMNYFFPINYTSIGFFTSIIYAFNLLILFYIIKMVSNQFIAIITWSIIFLIHPYAIYPWPDYFSGFFISLSCLFLLKNYADSRQKFNTQQLELKTFGASVSKLSASSNNKLSDFSLRAQNTSNKEIFCALAGVCLFASFMFRSTYLLSISLASLSYIALSLIDIRLRQHNIYIVISTFTATASIYMLYLYTNEDLYSWYSQAIGAGSSQYGMDLTFIYTILKNIFFPSSLIFSIFSIFYFSAIFTVAIFFIKRMYFKPEIIFLALMGMAGAIQSTHLYEIFRLTNASSPLYIIFAVIVYKIYLRSDNLWNINKIVFVFVFIFIFIFLALKFPIPTSNFPVYVGKLSSYSESKLPIFRWHQFRSDEANYYETLSQLVCDGKRKILNLTGDSVIPNLCKDQSNALSLPFFSPAMLENISSKEAKKITMGTFSVDEVIISDQPVPVNQNVKLVSVGSVKRPGSISIWQLGEAIVNVHHVELINK